MKKWMSLLLCAVMLTTLAACTEDRGPTAAVPTVPPEDVVGEGTGRLHAELLSNLDQSLFSRRVEYTVEEGAPEIALFTGGTVYNLRVEYGKINPEGMVFTMENEICRREQLDADTVIVLETYFPDTLPNIRVSCESAYGYQQFYLYQSGETGAVLLMDTVEAENTDLGTLGVNRLENVNTNGLMMITQQTVDPEGEKFVFLSEGTVNNIVVEYGSVEEGGFVPRKELVRLETMFPTDCVVVCGRLDTPEPRFRVSYEGAEGYGQYYVKQNDDNGHIYLEKAS